MCALTAIKGAFLNVKINAASYDDKAFTSQIIKEGTELEQKAIAEERELSGMVNEKISH